MSLCMTCLRAHVAGIKTARLWGQECKISPVLIEAPLGDGLQLLWVETMSSRPSFYVVRIDSSWDAERLYEEILPAGEYSVGDAMELVERHIEEECGCETESGECECDCEDREAVHSGDCPCVDGCTCNDWPVYSGGMMGHGPYDKAQFDHDDCGGSRIDHTEEA
jgi:hypothetical protein